MKKSKIKSCLLLSLFSVLFFTACFPLNTSQNGSEADPLNFVQYTQDVSLAESRFFLQIPEPVDEELVIEIIDDVTGVELNPTRYALQKIDETHYGVIIPLKIGAFVKYRYYRSAALPVYESDPSNQVIDYRAAYIDGARDFSDVLTNWTDRQYAYNYGRMEGQVLNGQSGSPLPDLLVIAGGRHVLTDSNGDFQIENLPPGKHNLTVVSTDGEYSIFQQEAVIGEALSTPAIVAVTPNEFVNITFLVKSPENIARQPLRIIGNTYQLGNVFGTVYNGESAVASRAPVLSLLPDGSYSITLNLPVGFNLVYKYSMGNGFWNAELDSENKFQIRSLIIPQEDTLVTDVIHNFQDQANAPIHFTVKIPENSPPNDVVSIQFSGFGWSSPIPMAKLGERQYGFTLYGPFNMVDTIQYRLCRNDSCSSGDEISLSTITETNWMVNKSAEPQEVNLAIDQWPAWSLNSQSTQIIAPEIYPKGTGFFAGFEINPLYNVFTPIYSSAGFTNMQEVNANMVVIPVTWSLRSIRPVIITSKAGVSPLWKDLLSMINKAQAKGLQVFLSPRITVSPEALTYLNQNELNEDWDQEFLAEYQRLVRYVADLAAFSNASGIILDGSVSFVSTSPNGDHLNQVLHSAVSANYQIVKEQFSGALFQKIYLDDSDPDGATLNMFDQVVVVMQVDLGEGMLDQAALTTSFIDQINSQLLEIHEQVQKPVIVQIGYPSAVGANRGCIQTEEECIDFVLVNNPDFNSHNMAVIDLNLQSQIYQAALTAINQTSWINGLISEGFNLQLALQDVSSSTRGKPAMDVLWYWYPRLLGISTN